MMFPSFLSGNDFVISILQQIWLYQIWLLVIFTIHILLLKILNGFFDCLLVIFLLVTLHLNHIKSIFILLINILHCGHFTPRPCLYTLENIFHLISLLIVYYIPLSYRQLIAVSKWNISSIKALTTPVVSWLDYRTLHWLRFDIVDKKFNFLILVYLNIFGKCAKILKRHLSCPKNEILEGLNISFLGRTSQVNILNWKYVVVSVIKLLIS